MKMLPVRALDKNLENMLFQLEGNKDKLEQLERQGKLSTIEITGSGSKINKLARIFLPKGEDSPKIEIEEPFLAYLWAMSYMLVWLTSENMKLSINKVHNMNFKVDYSLKMAANKLGEYGISLFKEWSDWPSELPTPESNKEAHTANGAYCYAALFVILHEIGHADNDDLNSNSAFDSSERANQELAADTFAVSTLMRSANEQNTESIKHGCVIGICAILLSSPELNKCYYPNMIERIENVVNLLHLEELSNSWAILCQGILSWFSFYEIHFYAPEEVESFKIFYEENIKTRLIQLLRSENNHC